MPEQRPPSNVRGLAREFAWFIVPTWAAILGVAEGTQWHAFGRADPFIYWSLLLVLMIAPLVAALGLFHAIAWLPITILVQDLFSLLAQNYAPWTADWYASFFPWLGPLAYPNGMFPWWYVAAWVLSFLLVVVATVIERRSSRGGIHADAP